MNIFNRTRDRLLDEFYSLRQSYSQATPFPHLIIDGLFDSNILYSLLNEFLFKLDRDGKFNWQITQDLKLESLAVARLSNSTRTFYFWLNSQDFIEALTLVVGREEQSLIGDPTLYGASLSEILPGGQLESCGQVTIHPHLPLVCQFNLIICLNNCLSSNSEGKIEIFSCENKYHSITYQPQFNRTLILPMTKKARYRITTSERSDESFKFFSIYYWSLIPM